MPGNPLAPPERPPAARIRRVRRGKFTDPSTLSSELSPLTLRLPRQSPLLQLIWPLERSESVAESTTGIETRLLVCRAHNGISLFSLQAGIGFGGFVGSIIARYPRAAHHRGAPETARKGDARDARHAATQRADETPRFRLGLELRVVLELLDRFVRGHNNASKISCADMGRDQRFSVPSFLPLFLFLSLFLPLSLR